MIEIFAIYTRSNSAAVKVQSIPAESESAIYILNPTVKGEMGNAESMDFSVLPGTPFYDEFIQLRTFIQVVYDHEPIFYGRVLTVSNGFFGEQKIHCEGSIAMLNDSYYPGCKESMRDEVSLAYFIAQVLDNHNAQVDDDLKKVYPGETPGNYSESIAIEQQIPNETRKFGPSSWTSTKSVLEDLKSHYGGVFRIRYIPEQNIRRLDWFNHYYRSTVNRQTVEVGKNILDISNSTEVSNVFTALIPIGKTEEGDNPIYVTGWSGNGVSFGENYIKVPQITAFFTEEELNSGYHRYEDYVSAIDNYGLIFKTVQIDEAHTQDELVEKAVEWIRNNYQGGVTSFSVKAIDLRLRGDDTDKLMVGDQVTISYSVGSKDSKISGRETRTLTCTGAQLDLYNPENNQYTFGIPANALGKMYGESSSATKKKSKSTSASPKADEPSENEPTDTLTPWVNELRTKIRNLMVWKKSTNDVPSGPTWEFETSRLHGYYLEAVATYDEYGNSYWALNCPAEKPDVESGYVEGNYRSWYVFRKDTQGRSKVKTIRLTYEQVWSNQLATILENNYVLDLIYYEWGLDLRKGSQMKNQMPSVWEDSDGNINYYASLTPGELTRKIAEYSATTGAMNYFGKSEHLLAYVDSSGQYHYYKKDPNDPSGNTPLYDEDGKPIELTFDTVDADVHTVNAKLTDAELLLAEHGKTISKNSSDIIIMGGDLTDAQASIAANGRSIMAINQQVTDITSQQVTIRAELNEAENNLVEQGKSITKIGSDMIILGGSLTEAEAKLVDMDKTIAKIDRDIVVIGGDLTDAQAKIAENGRTITAINSQVTDITSDQVTIKASLNEAENQLVEHGKSITKIGSDVTVIGGSLTELEANVAEHGVTLTKIDSDVTLIGSDLTNVEGKLAEQGVTLTKIGSDVTIIGGDLSVLEESVAAHGKTLTKIDTDITVIGGDLTAAQAKIAENGQTITAINSQVTDITSQQVTIQASLSEAEQKLVEQGASITKIGSDIVVIGGDLTAAQEQIAENGKSITAINSQVTDITSQQVTIQASLTAAEEALVEQGKSITKIGGDITVIGGDLTEAQKQLVADGKSITAINSDIVDIKGTLSAHDVKTKYLRVENGTSIFDGPISVTGGESISATNHIVYAGGSIDFWGASYGQSFSLSASDLVNLVKAVRVVEDEETPGQYKLQCKHYTADTDGWTDCGTFSKAASITGLTGIWSGADDTFPITVKVNPDSGHEYKIGFGNTSYDINLGLGLDSSTAPYKNAATDTFLHVPVKVYTALTTVPYTQTTRYSTELLVNAKPVYDAGFDAVMLDDPVWSFPREDPDSDNETASNFVTVRAQDKTDGTSRNQSIVIRLESDVENKKVYCKSGAIIRAQIDVSDMGGPSIDYLTGEWTGANDTFPLTVKTSPDTGKTYTIGFGSGYDKNLTLDTDGTPTKNADKDTYLNVPLKIYSVKSSWPYNQTTHYSTTLSVNATPVYNVGWQNCRADLVLPPENEDSDLALLKIPGVNPGDDQSERNYRIMKSTDWDQSAYVYLYDETNKRTVAQLNVGSLYNNGWSAAYDSVDVDGYFPTEEPDEDNFTRFIHTAKVNSKVDGARKTHNYYLVVDNEYAYIKYGGTNANAPKVARVTNNAYSNGWKAARSSIVDKTYIAAGNTYSYFPIREPRTYLGYFMVAQPSSTVDGDLEPKSYFVTVDADYAYVRYGSSADSAPVVARKLNTSYTEGQNSVTAEAPHFVTAALSGDKDTLNILSLQSKTSPTGNASPLTNIILSHRDVDGKAIGADIYIEAKSGSEVYGRIKVNHDPKISIFSATDSDPGETYTQRSITLSKKKVRWYTYTATCGHSTSLYKLKIDATELYNLGSSEVSLADYVVDDRQRGINESRTFTISTVGRLNALGVSSDISKTVPLHLYVSGWSGNSATAYLKSGTALGVNGTDYAKIAIDATSRYNQGSSDVSLNDYVVDARTTLNEYRTFSISTSGRKDTSGKAANLTKTVPLHLYVSGWSGNTATAYLRSGTTTGNVGTSYAQISIDASDRYKAGWGAGYDTFDSSGTTDTKTLNYSEAAAVTVKQKNKDGSIITRLSRTYTAPSDKTPKSGTASGRSGSSYSWTFAIKSNDNSSKDLTIDCSAIYADARSGYYTQTQYNNNYTTGYNNGSPSSGTASGRSGSSYDWTFNIKRADNTAKDLTIDCSAIYADARSGYYTQAEYNANYTSGRTYGYNESHTMHIYKDGDVQLSENESRPTELTSGSTLRMYAGFDRTDTTGKRYGNYTYIKAVGGSSSTNITDWNLVYAASPYTYHLKAYVNGGWQESGNYYATEAYNNGSPSSGTATGRSGSSYDWTFNIKRADNTAKDLTIDCSAIYADARSGYYSKSQYDANYNTGYDASHTMHIYYDENSDIVQLSESSSNPYSLGYNEKLAIYAGFDKKAGGRRYGNYAYIQGKPDRYYDGYDAPHSFGIYYENSQGNDVDITGATVPLVAGETFAIYPGFVKHSGGKRYGAYAYIQAPSGNAQYSQGFVDGWNYYEGQMTWYLPSDSPPSGYPSGRFYMPNSLTGYNNENGLKQFTDSEPWKEWIRGTEAWENHEETHTHSAELHYDRVVNTGSTNYFYYWTTTGIFTTTNPNVTKKVYW